MVRLLDNLEAAGLVERKEGEDRRAKIIVLTPRGRAIADKVETVARGVRSDALAGLSPTRTSRPRSGCSNMSAARSIRRRRPQA